MLSRVQSRLSPIKHILKTNLCNTNMSQHILASDNFSLHKSNDDWKQMTRMTLEKSSQLKFSRDNPLSLFSLVTSSSPSLKNTPSKKRLLNFKHHILDEQTRKPKILCLNKKECDEGKKSNKMNISMNSKTNIDEVTDFNTDFLQNDSSFDSFTDISDNGLSENTETTLMDIEEEEKVSMEFNGEPSMIDHNMFFERAVVADKIARGTFSFFSSYAEYKWN